MYIYTYIYIFIYIFIYIYEYVYIYQYIYIMKNAWPPRGNVLFCLRGQQIVGKSASKMDS